MLLLFDDSKERDLGICLGRTAHVLLPLILFNSPISADLLNTIYIKFIHLLFIPMYDERFFRI